MEVHCKYSIASYKPQFNEVYTCEVTKVRASPKNVFVDAHETEKGDDDVKYLRIKNKSIGAFPRNVVIKFRQLACLKIDACGIKKIDRKDFNGLENLEVVDLSRNLLTELPDDLFVDMKKLRVICFKTNKLESLSSKLLEPIADKLESANFEDNVKINDRFNIKVEQKNDLKQFMKIIDQSCGPEADNMLAIKQKLGKIAKPTCSNDFHKNLLSNLADIRAAGEYTDFVIKISGKQFKTRPFIIAEFKIHKCILAAQSSKFREIFEDTLKEKTFTEPENFNLTTFASFLDFFYSGVFDDDINVLEMFEFASVFDVPQLKIVCITKILATLNKSNAHKIYILGHQTTSFDLMKPAFVILQEMYPEITNALINDLEIINKIVLAKQAINEALFAKTLIL